MFEQKNNKICATFFSGNGYYLSNHIKSLFENILNGENVKIDNWKNEKIDIKFCTDEMIDLYILKKREQCKAIKNVKIYCTNKLLKKIISGIFNEKVQFFLKKSIKNIKNYYKFNDINKKLNIIKNGKAISNTIIIKKIEARNNEKVFETKQKLSDEQFIIEALLNKCNIGLLKGRFIFLTTSYVFDFLDNFFQLLNLYLI
jgi:hypothetical protein